MIGECNEEYFGLPGMPVEINFVDFSCLSTPLMSKMPLYHTLIALQGSV